MTTYILLGLQIETKAGFYVQHLNLFLTVTFSELY